MSKLVVQPSSIQSRSHRKLKVLNQLKQRATKSSTVQEIFTYKDPEQQKREVEEEEMRSIRDR